ncbi:MAG: UDP-4-amino-4,6-dideoxy-N-acetyl-beta-L-altrosamine N-acetyltransferase [Oceanicaulis sp.]|nr:UDP-4-amino-4,6-dideoxy-N-acetyl-beta-L-altrosamine N-acetyltransferase [Oceanicaulis sp.]
MRPEPEIAIDGIGALHRVDNADRERVRAWRNAPAVRAAMYTRHEISPAEHEAWWARHMSDPARHMFIAALDGVMLGVVSFTRPLGAKNASWAFYAAPQAPRGAGRRMEALALELAFGPMGVETLACEVRVENVRVIALHDMFGFAPAGEITRETPEGRVIAVQLILTSQTWAARRAGVLAQFGHSGGAS